MKALWITAITPLLIGADKPDRAPKVTYDPYTKTVGVTGASHFHNTLLDLNKTDWVLAGGIVAGVPHNPTLIYHADMPDWAFLSTAADVNGNPLHVAVISRTFSQLLRGDVSEIVAVELPIDYLRAASGTGLNIKISGSANAFVVLVPPTAIVPFLATFDPEVAKARAALQ